MEISEELRQARTDLAFALAQGDGYAEDAAAEKIARCEAALARRERCPVCGGLNPGDVTHARC